jgi:hypothetical protein
VPARDGEVQAARTAVVEEGVTVCDGARAGLGALMLGSTGRKETIAVMSST